MDTLDKLPDLDTSKEATCLFDEIEKNLLDSLGKETENIKVLELTETNPIDEASKKSFPAQTDFLTSSNDLLLPPITTEDDDPHNLNEEPLLFSVEDDGLKPITAPFMVPGIYKKIDASLINIEKKKQNDNSNVFVTQSEAHGRILNEKTFHEKYLIDDEIAKLSEEDRLKFTSKLFELKPLENVDDDDEGITPPLQQFQDGSKINKEWDPLTKLAYKILKLSNRDEIVIDRKRNEIVQTKPNATQRTIYRVLNPEDLGLKPRKNQENFKSNDLPPPLRPPRKKSRVGRPRKRPLSEIDKESKKKMKIEQEKSEANETKKEPPKFCTRFGRVVKMIKRDVNIANYMDEDKQHQTDDNANDIKKELLSELKDKDFTNIKIDKRKPNMMQSTEVEEKPEDDKDEILQEPLATSSPTKSRRVPPNAVCPTCKKIFLGRRLQRHYAQHPDHIQVTPPAIPDSNPPPPHETINEDVNIPEDMTLFRFLIAKMHKNSLNEDQRADLFLNELNDLVEQLHLRSSRLIRNTSGLHFVSARTARLLGIPEGQYALDMHAFDEPPEPETNLMNYESSHSLPAPPNTATTRSLDYTALSMDDTLTDEAAQKLNLSAGGKLLPPSEESLLRAVDDLVPGGMTKLVGPNGLLNPQNVRSSTVSASSTNVNSLPVPHYDQASDNAVEAVSMNKCSNSQHQSHSPILDLSVDFFQFKGN